MRIATTGPLYLLRHGETIWNRTKRLQGHKDTPLTLRGVQQAEAMGKALAQELNGVAPAVFFISSAAWLTGSSTKKCGGIYVSKILKSEFLRTNLILYSGRLQLL